MDLRHQQTGTPTGRPYNPDFVACSRSNPDSVLCNHDEWYRQWIKAPEEVNGKSIQGHRWQVVT